MAKRLTDSDLLIDYLNGRLGDPMRIVRDAREGRLVTSMVSRFEVLAGARSDEQFVRMARFLRSFVQIPLDADAADAAARIDSVLRADGIRLPSGDTLIAGIAVSRGLPLITRNRRHFERVPRLVIGDL